MRVIIAALVLALLPIAARAADDPLRDLMYVGEAADCVNSGIAQHESAKRGVRFIEVNPLLRPFAHGGVATYCAAPVVYDVALGALARNWPRWIKHAAYSFQIGSHAWGVAFTIKHTGR